MRKLFAKLHCLWNRKQMPSIRKISRMIPEGESTSSPPIVSAGSLVMPELTPGAAEIVHNQLGGEVVTEATKENTSLLQRRLKHSGWRVSRLVKVQKPASAVSEN